MKSRTFRILAVLSAVTAAGLLLTTPMLAVAADAWTTTQVTDNSVYDLNAHISGDRLVWEREEADLHKDIYTWAVGDAAPTNISNRAGFDDFLPQISGDRVVWRAEVAGGDFEIFMWTVGDVGPINISNRAGRDDSAPQISGNRVVWRGWDGNDYEVYTWAVGDVEPTNISNRDGFHDGEPQISGNRVAWTGSDSNDMEIYTWTVGDASPTNISRRDGIDDIAPQVSGDRVAWRTYYGSTSLAEIYTWSATSPVALNISHNAFEDGSPVVSGNRVVWHGWDGNDDEVYSWVAGDTNPTNISNHDGVSDTWPLLSENRIVWTSSEGAYTWAAGDSQPVNVSDAIGAALRPSSLSGNRIALYDSADVDYDIYIADPPTAVVEDQAAGVTFDRFVTGFNFSYSAGKYVYGRWADTELIAKFTGNEIRWVGPKQPGYGMADVYIDGVKKATVDCYSQIGTLRTTVWESAMLVNGAHTIKIRLTGAKNAASMGNVVVIDNFEVEATTLAPLGMRLNEQGGHVGFIGTWVKATNPTYTSSTYAYSAWAGTVYTASFTGTKVTWIGPKSQPYGKANVYVDGAFKATVDCYSSKTGWRYPIWESPPLGSGSHYIQIKPLHTKSAAATNYVVVVDGLDVVP